VAILPFRGLAEKGILHDPSPYQLDLDAWSDGQGIRFHGNKAMRAPIFRCVQDALPISPAYCISHSPSSGYDMVFMVGEDGTAYQYSNGTIGNITPTGQLTGITLNYGGTGYVSTTPPIVTIAPPSSGVRATATCSVINGVVQPGLTITNPGSGYTAAPAVSIAPPTSGGTATATGIIWATALNPLPITGAYLGSVTYINHASGSPLYYGPSSTSLQALPGWDASWSCLSLRAFGDYLIALNVTKGSMAIPSMVKWSDLTLAGLAPASWNAFDPTTSAGENPLEALTTPIVDGAALRSTFIIYSEDQIWGMSLSGDQFVFDFSRLFGDGGLISQDCAVEVDGRHYCFGPTDIYMHDGSSKQSIIDKRNRDYVFRNLNKNYINASFALYMPKYNEILFGYNSGDNNCAFPCRSLANPTGATRCNKGAIYNIPGDTWSFVDLPNVGAASHATLNTTLTYATSVATATNPALTYANIGGSYFDQDNTYQENVVLVSEALTGYLTNSRLLAYDFFDKGSLAFAFAPECNAPAFLERTGLDLDTLGSDLTTYKKVRRVYPLVTTFDTVPIQIQLGGSNTPSGSVAWGPPMTFDPTVQYKLDMVIGGRYLGIRFEINQPVDFEINGFDLDVTSGGRR
jgi:hypothetical protein